MTLPLRELQQAFAAAVLQDATAILTHVREGAFPAARHLQIYRNNTFANLTDALAACYPVVRRLVGEDFFEFAADGYIRQHPPQSGNLHCFGGALAQYLADLPSAQSLPYLADVARLEWARQQAYHAADAAVLSADSLAAIAAEDYPNLVFGLHPSAQLFESRYPCFRIWQVNQTDYDGDMNVHLEEKSQPILVIRRHLDIAMDVLSTGDFHLLKAFVDGQPLAEASRRASDADPTFDLAASLQRWVANGTITHVHKSPNNGSRGEDR